MRHFIQYRMVLSFAALCAPAELNHRVLLLGEYLRLLGVGKDKAVGVHMPLGVDYVTGCLAAMSAGGAYLPIEVN